MSDVAARGGDEIFFFVAVVISHLFITNVIIWSFNHFLSCGSYKMCRFLTFYTSSMILHKNRARARGTSLSLFADAQSRLGHLHWEILKQSDVCSFTSRPVRKRCYSHEFERSNWNISTCTDTQMARLKFAFILVFALALYVIVPCDWCEYTIITLKIFWKNVSQIAT